MASLQEPDPEVRAAYGLACYYAQRVENALVVMIVHLQMEEEKPSLESLRRLVQPTKATLGRLIARAAKLTTLPGNATELLQDALEKRNSLCHAFFWNRSLLLMGSPGRAAVLKELEQMKILFQRTDDLLVAANFELSKRYGITPERMLVKYINDTLAIIQSEGNPDPPSSSGPLASTDRPKSTNQD